MSDVKWIKITTNMFDDEKIRLIESMPDADAVLVIWVKLLVQTGRTNANGYIFLNENIPYTDEMLATIFSRPLNTVRLALQTFKRFGMIEMDENGIRVINWDKHQNIEGLEKIREQTRQRVAKHREQKKLTEGNATVTLRNAPELELDLDKDKKNIKPSQKFSDDSLEISLSKYLHQRIRENDPKAKTPNFQTWAVHMDKLMRIDKRSEGEIRRVIDFCQRDSFWKSNILSTRKLREKFTTLVIKTQTIGGSTRKVADF